MSLYSKNAKIDGLEFGLVMRGTDNGQYMIVFERECATLEQIEAINWEHPNLEGDCILPTGYGFEVEGVTYSSADKSFRATVRVGKQYLGDVTGYQEQIDKLRDEKESLAGENSALSAENAEKQAMIDELEEQLAEADEALIVMYEQQSVPAEPDTGDTADTVDTADTADNDGEEEQQA